MTTGPVNVITEARQRVSTPVSPLTVVMLIPKETGVTPAAATLEQVENADAAAKLGVAGNLGHRWLTLIEGQSNVHLFVLPFAAGMSDDVQATAPAALNALLLPEQRAKLYKVSVYGVDAVLAGRYTGVAQTANTIIQRLETVCADNRIKAGWVADGYQKTAADQTLAEAQAWAVANATRTRGIALANGAPVSSSQEFGSVIAMATLCRYAGLEGIGAHPFNLTDVVTGIGEPAPTFVFDSADSTAAAEVLDNTNKMTSIITHDGSHYLWGGKTTHPSSDPRYWWGNLMIQNRLEKRQRLIMEKFTAQRLSEELLNDLHGAMERGLGDEFGDLTRRIGIGTPEISGQNLTVPVETAYAGFVETITSRNSIFIQNP